MAGFVLLLCPPSASPLLAHNARSVDAGPLDHQRAEFLVRLTRFVSWPDSRFSAPDAALELCVVGRQPDAFAGVLRFAAAGATGLARPIRVRAMRPGRDADACHLVYVQGEVVVPTPKPSRYVHIVESLGALERSGMLAMVPEYTSQGESVLRFHGRRDRLRGAVPVLSAQLLKLVRFEAARP